MALRDAEFNKAIPYFDKAYDILDTRASTLSEAEKATYRGSITGLKEIYTRFLQKDKA